MKEAAESERLITPSTSWDNFLELASVNPSATAVLELCPALYYLAWMDREFVQALIDGEVQKKYFEDSEFQIRVRARQKLQGTPMICVNIIFRVHGARRVATLEPLAGSQADAQSLKWTGWGVTPEELEATLERMEIYISLRAGTQGVADEVDAVMMGSPIGSAFARQIGRKYLHSTEAIPVTREWIAKARLKLAKATKDMSAGKKKEPFPWCFQEVGFGSRASSWGPQHVYHNGTNYLFGVFTASLMSLYPRSFDITTYAVMAVMQPAHVDGCEVLGSLIGGSYGKGKWLGLNPVFAGGNNVGGPNFQMSTEMASLFEQNRRAAEGYRVHIMEENWAEDKKKIDQFKQLCKDEDNMPKLEEKAKAKKDESEKRKEQLTVSMRNKERMD